MISNEKFLSLKANNAYENLRKENLEIARLVANQPRVHPDSEFFCFGVVYNGESVRLFYEWSEVWSPKKLAAFNEKRALSLKSANERVSRDLDGVPCDDPDAGVASDEETIRRNLEASMSSDMTDDEVIPKYDI